MQGGIIALQIQHTLLPSAFPISEKFVFASQLPVDEKVVEFDLQLDSTGKVEAYRVKLNVSFKFEGS